MPVDGEIREGGIDNRQCQQGHLDVKSLALITFRRGFGGEEENSSNYHEDHRSPSPWQELAGYFDERLAAEQSGSQKAQVYQGNSECEQDDSENVDRFDDRENPDGIAHTCAERRFFDPLTEVKKRHGAVAIGHVHAASVAFVSHA